MTAPSDGTTPPASWYPDPTGRHELRWFDGTQWTDNVSNNGKPATDPVAMPGVVPQGSESADRVQRQVQQQAKIAGGGPVGGGSLFTEAILVVNQKAKLIELENEYAVYDQAGTQIGGVRQVGQSTAKKVLRALTNVDQFMTHKLQIVDRDGSVALTLTRPAKFVKSKVIVQDGLGNDVGAIVQQNAIGKIRFSLEAGGHSLGSINAENWRAWNFNVQDAAGVEVARITKTWEGLAKTLFTTADNYVVQIHHQLPQPLHSLVVAAALAVDTALKQDSRGLS